MKYGLLAVILALAGVMLWGIKGYAFPYRFNYKITIEIETPEGVKSGSVVRQVVNRDNTLFGMRLPETPSRTVNTKGEAVVIDLGERGVVFALVGYGSYVELYEAFPFDGESTIAGARYYNDLPAGKSAPLPEKNWPSFVTFTDIKDPKSVTLVRGWVFDTATQKQNPVDDFEKIFGSGVKVKNITITVTDERVTWGVVDRFLPSALEQLRDNWRKLPYSEKERINKLISFKQGE